MTIKRTTPTPEYEIKYLIAKEGKTRFDCLSNCDIDRLLEYFQNRFPTEFEDSVKSSAFSVLFYNNSLKMDHQGALRKALISVTCIDVLFIEIAKRIMIENLKEEIQYDG